MPQLALGPTRLADSVMALYLTFYLTGPSCSGLDIALTHLASKVLPLLILTNNSTKFDALISVQIG